MSTRKYLSGYEKIQKKEMLEMLEKLKYKNLIINFASQRARKIKFK